MDGNIVVRVGRHNVVITPQEGGQVHVMLMTEERAVATVNTIEGQALPMVSAVDGDTTICLALNADRPRVLVVQGENRVQRYRLVPEGEEG